MIPDFSSWCISVLEASSCCKSVNEETEICILFLEVSKLLETVYSFSGYFRMTPKFSGSCNSDTKVLWLMQNGPEFSRLFKSFPDLYIALVTSLVVPPIKQFFFLTYSKLPFIKVKLQSRYQTFHLLVDFAQTFSLCNPRYQTFQKLAAEVQMDWNC